jgi:uncharacterized protein
MLHYVSDADEVWHAGDIGSLAVADRIASLKPMKAVSGNIDDHVIRRIYPEELVFTFEGLKVLMIHIAGKPSRYSVRAAQLIKEMQPDMLVCGHSHILQIERDKKNNLLYINPGAAGKSGFHLKRTMIMLTAENRQLKHADVIDLGRRTI